MIKLLKDKLNNMDNKVKKIMHYGFIFSFIVCMISMALLITYEVTANLQAYYIGLAVFRLSLFFAIEFIISAIAIDTIKKQLC